MKICIATSDDDLTVNELKVLLENSSDWDHSISLEIHEKQDSGLRDRGIDPTVLVAICATTGATLGALITGLLKILQENYKEKVILETKDGLRIEIEARNALKKMHEAVKIVREMNINRIEF